MPSWSWFAGYPRLRHIGVVNIERYTERINAPRIVLFPVASTVANAQTRIGTAQSVKPDASEPDADRVHCIIAEIGGVAVAPCAPCCDAARKRRTRKERARRKHGKTLGRAGLRLNIANLPELLSRCSR
jgi:hypothetical protein